MKTSYSHLIIVVLFLAVYNVNSVNYYISASLGDDSRTSAQARSILTPWKTLSKLNSSMSILLPGDSVLFKRGDLFSGSIVITKSGNASSQITFSAYGQGVKPVISGLTSLASWLSQGSNVWEADCPACGANVNNLLLNNSSQQLGRYPNLKDANRGYLFFEAHNSNTQITDNQLPAIPNWTGAEVVVRTNHWVLENLPIKLHAGNTITYVGSTNYTPGNNWGYFIQKSPLTLDQFGEWYYNPSTKKIRIYTNSTNPSILPIEVATIGNLAVLNSVQYISLNNLGFKGSNTTSIDIYNSKSISISNCEINLSGTNAIEADNSSYITILNNSIIGSRNNALYLYVNCNNTTISNNYILNTGVLPGAGGSGDDAYQAIIVRGNNSVIEYNKIDSTGYVPIRFEGDNALVKNNYISNYLLTKDDGGGIYTWKGCSQTSTSLQSKVTGNIILNSVGAPEGTNNDYSAVYGIYMDDNVSNVEISGNTISSVKDGGIFIHNSHEISLFNNTSYNNGSQFHAQYNACPSGLIRNIAFNNNILFSKTSSQGIVDFQTSENDVKSFGTFDNNYYCRPVNEGFGFKVNAVYYNLSQWQTTFSKDFNSKATPIQIQDYTVNYLLGNNKYSNGGFNSNISGAYCWSPKSNCVVSWDNTQKLDGGSLKFTFSPVTGTANTSSLIIPVGEVVAQKKYSLRFSLKGISNNQTISANLRQSLSPYANLTSFQSCSLMTERTENEFIFSPNASESNASIQFVIDEAVGSLWIDNIEFYEADVTLTNPDEYIRFEYNASKNPKIILLSDFYVDVKGNSYSGSTTIQPFTSVIFLKKLIATKEIQLTNPEYNISVYPNPARESVTIKFEIPTQELIQMELINSIGVKVYRSEISIGTISRSLSLESMPSGAYVLVLYSKNFVVKKKIIVKKQTGFKNIIEIEDVEFAIIEKILGSSKVNFIVK